MRQTTALLVIDMQNGFLHPASPCYIAGAAATVPACAAVIRHCRQAGIPVCFVTRRYRPDGADVEFSRYPAWAEGGRPLSDGCPPELSGAMPEEFAATEADYHISKPRFSAFFQTELDLLLRRLGIRTLLLAGTTTPNCIRTTCYDALSLDYNVAVLSDCTSSATPEIQASNLRDMENIGAQILTSAAFLAGEPLADTLGRVQAAVRGE